MKVQVVRVDDIRLEVRFPYDARLIAAVKAVPGRTWDEKKKRWTIPDTPENVLALWRAMPKGATIDMTDELRAELRAREQGIKEAAAHRVAGDAEVDFDFVTQPYAHQRAGLAFLQKLRSGALLWEMGTGKTKTAIDYAEWSKAACILVITPNTVTRNWLKEIQLHAGHEDAIVLTGTLKQRAAMLGQARYSIVNVEALSLTAFVIPLLKMEWDLVIVDESTRFKSPKAKRTKALHKLRAKRRLILTGTPITNTAEDAWAQFEFIQPGLLGSYWHFLDNYLVRDPWTRQITGLKPGMEKELRTRIESRSYRVLKSEVLDLPPKVYVDRRVQLAGEQLKAYEQMKRDLVIAIANMPHVTAANILTQLLRLTQITAGFVGGRGNEVWIPDNAKTTELDALVLEEARHEQIVIVGVYQYELKMLALRYSGHTLADADSLPIIYGPTPNAQRDLFIREFQQGGRRLLFVQSRTGGIGINLTASQIAAFYTRSWSLEEWLQTQDRLHRIGQTGTVTILPFIAEKTVDEDIAAALAEKQELSDTLTGDTARKFAAAVLGEK